MPLAARLLLLVLLAVAPALGLLAYNERQLRLARAEELRLEATRTADLAASDVRQLVDEVQRLSAIVAKLPAVRLAVTGHSFSQTCSDLLVALRLEYPGRLEFGAATKDGLIVCTTQGATTARPVSGPQLARAIETNGFVIGGYGESLTTGARYLTFAYPVRDDAGQPQGAILAGVDLRWLSDVIARVPLPPHAVLSVHDRDLIFLARVPEEAGLIGRRPPPPVAALAPLADKGPMEATGADGRVRVGAIRSVRKGEGEFDKPDLSVAFGLSRDAAFAEIDAGTQRSIGLLLGSLLLALAAAWFGGRRFIRDPVDRLLAAAARLQTGDYAARVELRDRSSELGQLASAFDEMAVDLGRRDSEQRLLINELNHRVKNTLATVQSIAAQAFRRVLDPEVRSNFEARLIALAKTHDILTRESWESASVLDVVSDAIQPYADGGATPRFRVEGAAIRLPPGIVLPLSMALHELCTNAVKHGALSGPSGTVTITWTVDHERVRFRWAETGGPAVREPTRRGFGIRLIERGLAGQLGGAVELRFALKGVICEMDIPLRRCFDEPLAGSTPSQTAP